MIRLRAPHPDERERFTWVETHPDAAPFVNTYSPPGPGPETLLMAMPPMETTGSSKRGSSDFPRAAAPGAIPLARKSVRKAQTTRVASPSSSPFGMSRSGACASSAASGSSSMAR